MYQKRSESQWTQTLEDLRAQGSCELANVSAMALVEAFANDTELTISVGKRMLTHGTHEQPDPICADLGRAQVEQIGERIGRLPADWRVELLPIMTKWGAWSITLATAYHKLVPICEAADPLFARFGPDVWGCIEQPLPSEPDGKLVFDLIPMNKERGYCYGPYCAQAARAIDSYRAFLHVFSHFRTTVVHALLSAQCPFAFGGGDFLAELLQLRDQLPSVVRALKAAEPGLASTCVAPSRTSFTAAKMNWELSKHLVAERNARSGKHGE